MQAFKITINGSDEGSRFTTAAEAQMLAYVLADDLPGKKINVVELDQNTVYSVNDAGIEEIKNFLGDYHKKGRDHFEDDMLRAWASDAEYQLAEGNTATIEIKSWDCVLGSAKEYTISGAGISSEVIEQEV